MTQMTLTRREVAKSACAGVVAAAATRLWTPSAAFAQDGSGKTLVVLFLRGGLDGLSALVPYGDPRYYALRPTIGVAADQVIALDGLWGMNPAMAPLHDLYTAGHVAFVHSSGSVDDSRSHFDQQAMMESGTYGGVMESTGWLARHLSTIDVTAVPLHSMSWGNTAPASLLGDLNALSLRDYNSFRLDTQWKFADATRQAMRDLYRSGADGVLSAPGTAALDAMDTVNRLREEQPDVEYPGGSLARSLREIANTIKANVGLASATVDVGGWDIHADAGPGDREWGQQRRRLEDLSTALRAFADDLGSKLSDVTVVVMSEFGRTTQENASGGTDHGRGNLMMVMGAGIRGGVHGDWVGLDPAALDGGDVPVTTDYRNVVAELLAERHGNGAGLGTIFPGMDFAFRDLV